MRKLSFDQWEFNPPESEQSLDVAIASAREYAGPPEFLAACRPADESCRGLPAPQPIAELARCGEVLGYLREYAGLELEDGSWSAGVISDEWNDLELVLVSGRQYIWYRWETTA